MKPSLILLVAGCLGLAACDPMTLGLVTAGGGVAVNHQMSSTITRTFSDSAGQVHAALLSALDHMSIQITHSERRGEIEYIQAVAGKRAVSLQVEPVTRSTTLIEVAVHQDLLTLDGATGREIVAQTEQALGRQARLGSPEGNLATTATPGLDGGADSLPGRTTYYGYDSPPAGASAKAAHSKARGKAQVAAAGST